MFLQFLQVYSWQFTAICSAKHYKSFDFCKHTCKIVIPVFSYQYIVFDAFNKEAKNFFKLESQYLTSLRKVFIHFVLNTSKNYIDFSILDSVGKLAKPKLPIDQVSNKLNTEFELSTQQLCSE